MIRLHFLLALWIGLTNSLPTMRQDLASTNTAEDGPMNFEVGSRYTDQVEFTIPFKIANKAELVTWVTYAMRMMANRINVTLEAPNPEISPEKIEKLRNSSIIINHLIDTINSMERMNKSSEEQNKPENTKISNTMSFSTVKVICQRTLFNGKFMMFKNYNYIYNIIDRSIFQLLAYT
jgi:hypothetical protein